MNRDFRAAAPNRRWVADVTEFACGDGKLYLAAIRGTVSWPLVAAAVAAAVLVAALAAVGLRKLGRA